MQVERYHLSRLAHRIKKRFHGIAQEQVQRRILARRVQKRQMQGSVRPRRLLASARAALGCKPSATTVHVQSKGRGAKQDAMRLCMSLRQLGRAHTSRLLSQQLNGQGFGELDTQASLPTVTGYVTSWRAGGATDDLQPSSAEAHEERGRLLAVANRFLSVAPAHRKQHLAPLRHGRRGVGNASGGTAQERGEPTEITPCPTAVPDAVRLIRSTASTGPGFDLMCRHW
jgi:hypothetical protein